MGKGPKYPNPTGQERLNMQAQTDVLTDYRNILAQQQQTQGLLAPHIYRALRVNPLYSEGQLTGFEDLGQTPEEQTAASFLSGVSQQLDRANQRDLQQGQLYDQQLGRQGQAYDQANQLYQQMLGQQNANYALQQQLLPEILQATRGAMQGGGDPNDPLYGQRRNLENAYMSRAERALYGNMEEDPLLARRLREQESELRANLQRELGGGYATSTPGIQALQDFGQRKAETLYGTARDEADRATTGALNLQRGNLADRAFDLSRSEFALRGAGALQNVGAGLQNAALGYRGLGDDLQAAIGGFQGLNSGILNAGQAYNSTAAMLAPFALQGTTGASLGTFLQGMQAPYAGANGLATLSQLYGQSLDPYAQNRQGQFIADTQRSKNTLTNMFARSFVPALGGSLGQGLGQVGSAGLMGII